MGNNQSEIDDEKFCDVEEDEICNSSKRVLNFNAYFIEKKLVINNTTHQKELSILTA